MTNISVAAVTADLYTVYLQLLSRSCLPKRGKTIYSNRRRKQILTQNSISRSFKVTRFRAIMYGRLRSSKFVDYETNRMYDVLLVIIGPSYLTVSELTRLIG